MTLNKGIGRAHWEGDLTNPGSLTRKWQCHCLGEKGTARERWVRRKSGRCPSGVCVSSPWGVQRPLWSLASLCSDTAYGCLFIRSSHRGGLVTVGCWEEALMIQMKQDQKMLGWDICCFSLLFGSLFWFPMYHAKNKNKDGLHRGLGGRKRVSAGPKRMRPVDLASPLCQPLWDKVGPVTWDKLTQTGIHGSVPLLHWWPIWNTSS